MVEQDDKRPYEAMFLVDSGQASTHWSQIEEHIRDILVRHGVDLIGLSKWDDRSLAYTIQKKRRGTYILSFFNAPPSAIVPIQRDCQLSEQLLRVLILTADHLRLDDMKMQLGLEVESKDEDAPATEEPKPAAIETASEAAPAEASPASPGE